MGSPKKNPATPVATKPKRTPKIRDIEVLRELKVEELTNAEKSAIIKDLRTTIASVIVQKNLAEKMVAEAKSNANDATQERDMLMSKVDTDIAYLTQITNAYVSSIKRIIGGK